MRVLYATDGFESAIDAGVLLEKIGDRDRIDITVMSVTHRGVPAPEHLPLMLDPLPSRQEDTVSIVDGAVEKLLEAGCKATGRTAEGHPGQEIVRVVGATDARAGPEARGHGRDSPARRRIREPAAHVATGNPTQQLLEEAHSGSFDLVAVGSRGLGPFRRALLGSVSDHVVRHSRAALVGRRLTT